MIFLYPVASFLTRIFNPRPDQAILEGRMNLVWNVNKQLSSQCELKNVALATTRNGSHPDNSLQVHTDGLVGNTVKNVVMDGAYCSIFSISCRVKKYCNNFDGEFVAILFEIDKLIGTLDNYSVSLFVFHADILLLTNSKYNKN